VNVRGVELLALFPLLRHLELGRTAVDSAALVAFVQTLHEVAAGSGRSATAGVEPQYRLQYVGLSFCARVSDGRCLASIPSLRQVDFSGTPITNDTVVAFSLFAPVSPGATGGAPATTSLSTPATLSGEEGPWSPHTLAALEFRRTGAEERVFPRKPRCRLTELNLQYCAGVTSVEALFPCGAEASLQNRCSLRELNVHGSGVDVRKEALAALAGHGCRIHA